ncbi:MAG TPA: hypothetical protein PLB63_01570 [Planctomycetota bacterium]|nr:hypothetical protein [Planctomycetota bacterium]HQA99632.1 hypothetical protein [Planctomycetota bacterium]
MLWGEICSGEKSALGRICSGEENVSLGRKMFLWGEFALGSECCSGE